MSLTSLQMQATQQCMCVRIRTDAHYSTRCTHAPNNTGIQKKNGERGREGERANSSYLRGIEGGRDTQDTNPHMFECSTISNAEF